MDQPSDNPQANPAHGSKGKCAFQSGDRQWEERFDLVQSLSQAMAAKKIGHRVSGETLNVQGIHLAPGIVHIQPMENGGVRTLTTIEYAFDPLRLEGIFEFQHATGSNLDESLRTGFAYWVDSDLPVMIEALTRSTQSHTKMTMETKEGLRKVAYLGNPLRLALRTDKDDPCHPFCPCCLFTNSLRAFEEQLKQPGFFAIRLLASRSPDGEVSADCRINGVDFDPGFAYLRSYAEQWPDQGFEMRKQYVILMDETIPVVAKPSLASRIAKMFKFTR